MSYSIGPFMGKRDAVIAALKRAAEGYGDPATSQSRKEADAAVAFIVPQIEKLAPEAATIVTATGSATGGTTGFTNVQHNVQVGLMPVSAYYGLPRRDARVGR